MPWREIAFWAIGLLLDSRGGIDVPGSLASNYIQNSSYKQVNKLAIGHIMDLSFEFHSSKSTGEILETLNQAWSLNSLVELVTFRSYPSYSIPSLHWVMLAIYLA